MTVRTVISFDPSGNNFIAKVVRAPLLIPQDELLRIVDLNPEDLPPYTSQSAVLERGKMIRNALQTHPGINMVLNHLSQAPLHEVYPLFIMLGLPQAERINWEMLCDADEAFVALDPRWPIARIIDPINAENQPPCEFISPVRLLVVISALGVKDQEKEWKILRNAVVEARKSGLAIEMMVFVGQHSLHEIIVADSKGIGGIEVRPIHETSARLTQAIRQWSPHIIHFFCHGYSGVEGQWLELATANDHLQYAAKNPDVTTGSVKVSVRNLATLSSSLENTWLMVLNCCSSGNASDGLQSMANQIVTAGIPAVVAMMEPVSTEDAYEFTQAFYPDALASLDDLQTDLLNHSSITFEWTSIMYQVRSALAEKRDNNENSKEWSLPMLYVRGVNPQVFIRPLDPGQQKLNDYRVSLKIAAQWLRTAGQHYNDLDRAEALEKGLEGVPRDLWPDLNGEFPNAPGQ